MDAEDETAVLEGWLLGEAERILIRVLARISTDNLIDQRLHEDIGTWRLAVAELMKRWQQP